MVRIISVYLATLTAAFAASVWDGEAKSVKITTDPGNGIVAVQDGVLTVTAENAKSDNRYLFFSINCKPFSLKDKALSMEAWTSPEARGCSFYVFCYNAEGGCPAAGYSTGGLLGVSPRRIVLVPGRDGTLTNYASKVNADTGKPVTRIVIATCKGARSKLCIRLKNLEVPSPRRR